MAHIKVENLSICYPVFDAKQRTLKGSITHSANTGGAIFSSKSNKQQGVTYIEALRDISFVLDSGARLGVYGHNGSGKTTLLKVLAGIYSPVSGKVDINGTVGSFVDIAAGVDGDLTGYDNIYIRGLMMGHSRDEIDREAESIIEFSGLGEFIQMPIRTYSSGMWARLVFSIATSFHSNIILLDEWLSVGDEVFQKKAQMRLTSVINNASILILASQSMDLLQSRCNEIITLEHGRILSKIIVDSVNKEVS